MNKAPFILFSNIRTNSSDKLLNKISLNKIYFKLIDLFDDRTKKNNSMFINGDDALES